MRWEIRPRSNWTPGTLAQLLLRVTPRCAAHWAKDTRSQFVCHTCTRWPGHPGDHVCPCGARLAQAGAA